MKREIKSVVPFCDLKHRGPNAWIENMMITMIRFCTWKTVFDEFLVLLHKRVLEKYSHMNKKKTSKRSNPTNIDNQFSLMPRRIFARTPARHWSGQSEGGKIQ